MNREKLDYKFKPRRSYAIPQQTWRQRNPRLFIHILTAGALLIFFSRPLYDAFLRPESEFLPPPTEGQPRPRR